MLDVRRLRLLRELALRGTIAAVAEALAFSPSAVSQQLSALEREAGVPLLERTGRRVVLTPAGQRLAAHAEAVLERLERAGAELAATRGGPTGPLRIGAFPTAARALLPPALAALAVAHPRLEPAVEEVDAVDVPDALRARELDVVLVHEYDLLPAEPEDGVETEPVCEEPVFLAEPDTGGASRGGSLVIRRDEPWIVGRRGTLCHTMALRACEAAGFRPRIRHLVDEYPTVLALVAARQGVALVPRLGAVDPPEGVRLTPVAMRRRIGVAYRAGSALHPSVAALTHALRRQAR
ncbi:LysR family transcriptional regulator [Streptomyces boncukensis]|uniref:LysR family transcriptional regulator n=1 Tax=Streptomyces boncukensis TaxID=2711219 RepID=A0A6G4WRS7_9ACTN|nr:LysR family transcriptional regulator [Streptomyces boncukensis]NGO67713.1 LysR family transcriptional regulator [Streptomyces boncukensis]